MRAFVISLLLALAGVTASYRLFPSVNVLGKYPARISRGEAIAQARVLAARYGRNVDDWPAWVQVEQDRHRKAYEFHRTSPDHPIVRVPQPYSYIVDFTQGPLLVRVELFGNGKPIDFFFRDGRHPEFAGQPLSEEQEKQVLADFTGPDSVYYRKVGSVNRGTQGHVATWEWSSEDLPDLIQHLEVTSGPDGVRHIQLHSEWSQAFLQRWIVWLGRTGIRLIVLPILLVIGIGLTNALFFTGLARGQIKLRPALRMLGVLTLIWLVGFVAGSGLDRLLIKANADSQPVPEPFLQALGLAIATMGLFPAMWAIGRWLMRSSGLERWQTWDALVEGVWWRREVGRSVACGLLLGASLTAIPHALAATHMFLPTDANTATPAWLAAAVPAALPLTYMMPWDVSAIFFLLAPFASTQSGRKWVPAWVRWILVGALGMMLVSVVRNMLPDSAGGYVAGGLLAGGFFAIYRWLDLLAVMMAELGYEAASVAVYYLNQQSPGLQSSGAVTAAVYGAMALAGVAALLWARELEVTPEETVVEIAAEREILESEFAMAREAQRRLLPAIPPRLDGFSLAASCHPARDVGGDLYDFFRFPDGTYGMCVADVSGKGVPAALYMTMTKGILAAASRDPADLPGLAAALNAQLYTAGRKKTFVTMALGRLDTASRRLEYLRAGHNSILWRHSSAGTCEYRKPRGVGLGLATSRVFDRSIEMETLALEAGDMVVFYSDGITEAMNSSRELFGEERLEAVVQRHANLDATGLETAILREVRRFMAGEPPHDDMTLLVLRA